MTCIAYKIGNGLRHGERKTLEGAKAFAEKIRKNTNSNNHVWIVMIYFDEQTQSWKEQKIQ